MGVQLPSEPITRKERYLAKAAGQAVEIPAEPITREEAYLEKIAEGSGGGGTNNYNQLSNKPKINNVELSGNKSLSDLGIASATDLANKVDKVNGKGLSTNDYTNTDKEIVEGVPEAIAGKQDKYETITYAEWQAMTPEQQAAKDYYISDYPASAITAGNIDYDNRTSGMTANKVQGAIDELKSGLTVKTATVTDEHFSAINVTEVGGVKSLYFATTGNSTELDTTADYVKYFTLPAGFRPASTYTNRFVSKKSAATTDTDWIIKINTNGDVYLVNYSGETSPGFANTFVFI